MKLLKVDDVEIEFEQQAQDITGCRWMVHVKIRKGKHEKTLLGIMTDNKPYVNFTYCTQDMVIKSDQTKKALCL
jgi:hypothetical protein